MRINTLTSSLFALGQLSRTQKAFQRALSRLASGQRINSASDDPAGLAIATGLEAQRRGVAQAIRNLNDARGFLNTAEGAMQTQSDIIQRMRELALQASNGILSSESRSYLETEFQQLYSEFKRITSQTEFNGVALLDGTFGTKSLQVGTQKNSTIDFNLASMKSEAVFTQTITCGDGTFQTRRTYATGTNPRSITTADLNNDGYVDLLDIDYTAATISYRFGNGDGTFQTRKTLQVGTQNIFEGVKTADLNGDGYQDIVCTDEGSGTISVFLNNGSGGFQSRVTFAVGTQPRGLVLADFNADGKVDIATASYGDHQANVLLGNGDGSFQTRANFNLSAFGGSYDLTSGDVNGDGKIDLISADYNNGYFTTLLGNGNGTFQSPMTVTAQAPYNLKAGDFNNDGKLDIIAPNLLSNVLTIGLGNGDGTYTMSTFTTNAAAPLKVEVKDFNGDGNLDVAYVNNGGTYWSLALGNGNGTFRASTTMPVGSATHTIIGSDLNGDGALDMIGSDAGDNTVSIYMANTTTRVKNPTVTISTQSSASTMLEVMDNALKYINASRSKIGAYLSRIDSAESVNSRLQENLSAARSQIMDADMAQETAEFVRLQILQQAGLSVLSQAHINAKLALKLLNTIA